MASFKLTFSQISLELSKWLNSQRADLRAWDEAIINALDVFDLFDDVVLPEMKLIDTAALEEDITTLKAQSAELESAFTGSSAAIESAWSDLRALIAEPIPSEGFDNWFKRIINHLWWQ